MPDRPVVCNTSPLLYLYQVGQLGLLRDLYGQVLMNGLTYTGTLGVLIRAKREGLLSKVAPVIEALRQTIMHLTPALIEAILKDSEEI